jgi:hypothetical protein
MHRKKRFTSFQSPAGISLTKLPLGRNNSVMMSLFPPRESLVVTSRLGTGNSRTFFLRCGSFERCERNSRWIGTLQRTNTGNLKKKNKYFQKRNCAATFSIFKFICQTVYIPTIDLPILLQKICGPIPGNLYKSLTDT